MKAKWFAAAVLILAATARAQAPEVSFTNGASSTCSLYPLVNGSEELLCIGVPVTVAGQPDGSLTIYEFTAYTDKSGVEHPAVGKLVFAKADGEVYTSTDWNYDGNGTTNGWNAGDDSYTATNTDGSKTISGVAHETIRTTTYCWRTRCTSSTHVTSGIGTE